MEQAWHSRVLLLAALGGCEIDPNATLADLPGLTASLVVNPHIDGVGQSMNELTVYLAYDFAAFSASHAGACAQLDDGAVRGAVDDANLEVAYDGALDPELDECAAPYLVADAVVSVNGVTHVVVSDATRTIDAELAPGLAVARHAAVVGSASWVFPRGGTFSIRWSHPEDLVGLAAEDISGFFDDHRGHYASMTGRVTSTDTIELAVPMDAPVGSGELFFSLGRFGVNQDTHGNATSCTGAAACTYKVTHDYAHVAEIN